MKSKRIHIGDKFSRWTVIWKLPSVDGQAAIECRCECGTVKQVRAHALRSGRSASCGCLRKEIVAANNFKHGGRDSLLYRVWANMIQRCENPRTEEFKNYGGRGIKVCDAWHDYAQFLSDMGATYQQGLEIDRKNNDGDYEPSNCRWVTRKVNGRNQRRSIRVERNGSMVSLRDLADLYSIRSNTAYSRYKLKGWTLRQSLGIDAPPPKGCKPISDETRQRMADARRQWWTRQEAA